MELENEKKTTATVKTGSGCCTCLLFFAFLIADIWILVQDWGIECDQRLQLWIIINIVVWFIAIFLKAIPTADVTVNCVGFLAVIGELAILIWGWIIFCDAGNCHQVIPDVYNLVLAHLIVQTIIWIISVLILSCTCCTLCGVSILVCLDAIGIKKKQDEYYILP